MMKERDLQKLIIVAHYVVSLWFVGLWAIMMFFPGYAETIQFRLILGLSCSVGALYGLGQKKYYPTMRHPKVEKIIAALLIVTLVCRLIAA